MAILADLAAETETESAVHQRAVSGLCESVRSVKPTQVGSEPETSRIVTAMRTALDRLKTDAETETDRDKKAVTEDVCEILAFCGDLAADRNCPEELAPLCQVFKNFPRGSRVYTAVIRALDDATTHTTARALVQTEQGRNLREEFRACLADSESTTPTQLAAMDLLVKLPSSI
jgi:hypothetical protein